MHYHRKPKEYERQNRRLKNVVLKMEKAAALYGYITRTMYVLSSYGIRGVVPRQHSEARSDTLIFFLRGSRRTLGFMNTLPTVKPSQ